MKYFVLLLCAAFLCAGLTGCISEEVEPQQVEIRKVDGSLVTFKDLYEINSDRAIDFGNSRVFPLYNCINEELPGDYAINIVAMEPKVTSALFTQKTTQILYVLAGGGMIDINGKSYEMREGVTLYIPANQKMRVTNNSPFVLKWMEISTPCGEANPIILEKAPEVEKASDAQEASDKDLLKRSEKVTGNAQTSPTLDQINPVTLNDDRDPQRESLLKKEIPGTTASQTAPAKQDDVVKPADAAAPKQGDDSDRANSAIINKDENILNAPAVKPVDQTAVKTLTPEEKIMQDKQ